MREANEYLLGTSDRELQRLEFQHRVWRKDTERLWDAAGFDAGKRLLDVGCGPGFATADLQGRVGNSGEVVGIDISERFVAHAGRLLNEGTRVEVTSIGDFVDDQPFDGIFLRWVLCFLPNAEETIAKCASLLKPGGVLAVMDYFHYSAGALLPEAFIGKRMFDAFRTSVEENGGSYEIGRRALKWMRRNGLDIVNVDHVSRLGRPGTETWQWFTVWVESFVPRMVDNHYISRQDADQFLEYFAKLNESPDSLFFAPPVIQIVGRK